MGQSEHPQRQRVRGYQRSVGHIVLQSIILQRSNPARWCLVLPTEAETRSLPSPPPYLVIPNDSGWWRIAVHVAHKFQIVSFPERVQDVAGC